MNQTLIIFAREPRAGITKTRLCPPLTPEQAAQLYAAFLADMLTVARGLTETRLVLSYTPESNPEYFSQRAPDFELHMQQGENLGERMANAFAFVEVSKHHPVVLIGSDFPHIPIDYLEHAFLALRSGSDSVFGPTDDGGYYLVGLRNLYPELFEMPMSHPNVLRDSLGFARRLRLSVALAPATFDIDTSEDLTRLRRDLQHAPAHIAPNTRMLLAKQG